MNKIRMKRILMLLIVMLFGIGLVGCNNANNYTEEEHITNVSKIIEENYLNGDITYELRPLYDYNDKLSYFVVDFSNDTYFYIKIQDKDKSLFWGNSLYTKDVTGLNSGPWRKSKFVEENGQLIEKFEKDESGNDIYYKNSHFSIAKIKKDTKCYLIVMRNSENNIIPAIKNGEKYINLITMEEFEIYSSKKYPNSGIAFNFKSDFNL